MSGPVAPRRVAVIGAGITGLVAAHQLAAQCAVVLFEKEARLGGKLSTGQLRGLPIDLGADSFITRNPAAVQLCEALGLGDELIAPAGAFAAIFARRQIRALPGALAIGVPTQLRPLFGSRVLSKTSALRAGLDYLWPRAVLGAEPIALAQRGGPDPTVAEVVRPRLGRAVLYGLVDPLVGGINASDVDSLSFAAALPSLARQAGGQHSLMRALRVTPPTSAPESRSPLFFGLERGIESLIERLAKACTAGGVEIRTAQAIETLHRAGDQTSGPSWSVRGAQTDEVFDAVILALPAPAAAALLEGVDGQLQLECGAIAYSGVVTIGLAWPEDVLGTRARRALADIAAARPGGSSPEERRSGLLGNGLLVTRGDRQLVTAVTFTSTKWPRSKRRGEIVVRVSAGRHGDERALELGDEALLAAVRADLRTILGIEARPLESLIQRWPTSFPQYTSGHLARQVRIEALLQGQRGLALAGAGYHGIGIPACIDSARRACETVLNAIST